MELQKLIVERGMTSLTDQGVNRYSRAHPVQKVKKELESSASSPDRRLLVACGMALNCISYQLRVIVCDV